jgi:hypothetical protein
MKDVIDEAGPGFLSQEALDSLSKHIMEMYGKSDERILENNNMAKNQDVEDEDDQLETDELEIIKEENKNEYDLQLSFAELIGVLFKTHKDLAMNLLNELFTNVLPPALLSEEKQKQKFALFILDDTVEYLGPTYLGSYWVQVASSIIKFCSSTTAGIRQAASYGIGMLAQHGGDSFNQIQNECL